MAPPPGASRNSAGRDAFDEAIAPAMTRLGVLQKPAVLRRIDELIEDLDAIDRDLAALILEERAESAEVMK